MCLDSIVLGFHAHSIITQNLTAILGPLETTPILIPLVWNMYVINYIGNMSVVQVEL